MRRFVIVIIGLVRWLGLLAQAVPSSAQLQWQEAEMGAIFHYDLHVFDGERYSQEANRRRPVADRSIFAPPRLDTDQWVLAARDAGCRFALLTATHETGFSLWQSDVNPYCLSSLKWQDGKGDIVRDFVASCRKYGLLPGLYVGIRWNSWLGVSNFKAGSPERQAWYKRYCEQLVEELCTRYGTLFMLWFDGGADDPSGDGPDVEPIVRKYQPQCLFYHNVNRADLRWGGSESGRVPYPCWSTFPYPYSHGKGNEDAAAHLELLRHGDPSGPFWMSAMADFPLRGAAFRHEWFWEPGDEETVMSLSTLMDIYEQSVGHNATLVVGLAPSPEGILPEGDTERLKEWGAAIRARYGTPLAATSGTGKSLRIRLERPSAVSRVVLMEEIAVGERVRSFTVEAYMAGQWKRIAGGNCIGHKYIASFDEVVSDRFRLTVTDSVGPAQIKAFEIY